MRNLARSIRDEVVGGMKLVVSTNVAFFWKSFREHSTSAASWGRETIFIFFQRHSMIRRVILLI